MQFLLRNSFKVLLLSLLLMVVGCASDAKKSDGGDTKAEEVAQAPMQYDINGTSDENTAGELQTVTFAFDSSQLSSEAKAMVEANATWLQANPTVDIQVEGHCDERGGHQYNLALGERRARVVRDYLMALGIEAPRISIISYGKEKPLAFGHGEDVWMRNRRANFVITAK